MSLAEPNLHTRNLFLEGNPEDEDVQRVLKAMASETRLRILHLLGQQLLNVSEVAQALDLPISTANMHINILEAAGLLLSEHKPATRGSQKVCSRAYDTLLLQFPKAIEPEGEFIELSTPVGGFVDCQVVPTCGLANEAGLIGLLDDPASFYEVGRAQAQLLWFHQGYVKYRFPNRLPPKARVESLSLSFEVCSEAPMHHNDWPSDITVWINEVEAGTWTSPADFGGQRGKLTPAWWEGHNSQYGLLKVWQVNQNHSLVDGLKVSSVTLNDLNIGAHDYLSVRIGVKEDARFVGGINLFGRAFGNYPQDIILRLRYTHA